jgi:sugar phosphate isomerase/epimerase
MGKGLIDWVGQYEALKRDGYRHAVSLETHWRGAGTPEASTIQSWAGMNDALKKAGII